MAKKVLIISTSLRGGSNSDMLAKECAKGAKEAGHDVELLSLKGKDIKYCIGCLSCQKTGMCVLKDDVAWSSYNKDKLENSSKYKGLH